ncbi:MAG TPA: PspC domain-containing protein [Jiangellaceae bacterium]|nr:PspC domain-containing protein [Jiangellaceae bacterium]
MSTYSYDTPARRRLVRPRDGRVIAGVCAGLAKRFNLSTTAVRVIFLLLIPLPGPILIIYLALWLIMPNGD